ncbi:amidohydrolase family protein [Pseudoflavonifractor sp. HCP28S3_F10]|uniref:amidohydrolase family protein n=1 Tax=Pseudoflavonifractor sp. HCP28S3_F10 TaxID=3438947 RepID=UPI003F8BA8C6
MIDHLLKNGIIVTVNPDREVFFHGAVAVQGNKIVDVGESAALEAKYPDAAQVTDLEGKIVFPGFVNTHNHLFQTLLKGLGDDMVLKDWLETMTFPAATNLTREDCYLAAMLGCMEGLHSGITTMLDYMYPHPTGELSDGVIDAMRELGIRGILGRGCMDTGAQFGVHPGIMQDMDTIEKDLRRLFETYHNSENGRIKIWVAPAAMWSNSRPLLEMLWRVTNEYKSGFTVHISETPFDRDAAEELHGKPDAELLEEMGIVGPNVLMVHCCYLTDKDIAMAKKYDMKVSHNVCSNQYLSSGVADVPKMLRNGITVSLGVDGAASNNAQDMVELMKFTALQHKVATRDPLAMTAEKVLEMATIDGARALGMEDEIGSLEVGKKADLVIFDPVECPKAIPMHNPVSTLVYSASMKNIVGAMVDGKVVMENGVITTVKDEKEIYRRVQKCAEDLCERGHITNRREGHKWNRSFG